MINWAPFSPEKVAYVKWHEVFVNIHKMITWREFTYPALFDFSDFRF